MMAVDIATGPAFRPGAPRVLFEGNYLPFYDVTPDGQFVMIERPEVQPFIQIHLVFNWLEELKKENLNFS